MLFYNADGDYGFIRTDDGERIAVSRSGFVSGEGPEGRCAGMAVTLTAIETPEGRIATEVQPVVEKSGGRARRRSH